MINSRFNAASGLPTIVVVNDDVVGKERFSLILEQLPAKVVSFESVEPALSWLGKNPGVDLIVTDLYMPGIDGWRFCRLLRSPEYPRLNAVPVVALSATFSGDHPSQLSRDIGADAFLSFPVEPDELLKTARFLLSGGTPVRKRRVLIIDDDIVTTGILGHGFNHHGYDVHKAETGEQAIRLFESRLFDFVLIDFHLPDTTGDMLLSRFFDRDPHGVFVMMTTDPRPDLAVEWMQSGASAYLRKPVAPEFVVQLCERVARERALLRIESVLDQRTKMVEQLLQEKELLLREVHHRVKNNMGSVAGYLDLRASRAGEPAATILRQAKGYVQNIVTIYDLLHTSEDVRSVALEEHLKDLMKVVVESFAMSERVSVDVQAAGISLPTDQALSVGIIVNELVTNAIKHAFPNDRSGTVAVYVEKTDESWLNLTVRDDGVGTETTTEDTSPSGFGTTFVKNMVEQLGGTIRLIDLNQVGRQGTTWEITIPWSAPT